MAGERKRLAILCGGGPAPGMNSVIAAATIEAINRGHDVLGIRNGFEHLVRGETQQVVPLTIEDVSRIHGTGGSILFTSRANPTKPDAKSDRPNWRLENTVGALRELRVDGLLTIGGDDTAHSAATVARELGGHVKVVHVPKTIDNDLPLPGGKQTFGYETARHIGTHLVNNLMTDAMTTRRWFVVVAMGRAAGHLALGIGKAAGATTTLIAEEFRSPRIALKHVVDLLETSVLKRRVLGRPFGVAILAEGIGLQLPQEELEQVMPSIERDEHGHIRLAELHLQRILANLLRLRFHARGDDLTVVAKNIGYELRCSPPIPFDVEYTRDLGYCAVEYLTQLWSGPSEVGAMITFDEDKLRPLPFGSFTDPQTGRPYVRTVNVESASYAVAREYMIRLEASDFEDADRLAALAKEAKLTPDEFRKRFGYLVDGREPILTAD